MSSSRAELESLSERQLLIRLIQLLEELVERTGAGPPPHPVPPPHHP